METEFFKTDEYTLKAVRRGPPHYVKSVAVYPYDEDVAKQTLAKWLDREQAWMEAHGRS